MKIFTFNRIRLFLLLSLVAPLYAANVFAAPNLTVGTASGQAGTTVTVPITFDPTTASVAGIQFNIVLPAGLSTGTVTAGSILNTAGKSVSTNLVGNVWTFIVFGINQTSIASGSLFSVQLSIAPGTPVGSLSLPVSGLAYSDPIGNGVPAGTTTGGSVTVIMPVPVILSTGTATGQVGVAFSYQISATNAPISYNATGLPAGLNINTGTGLISGTPTTAATSNITLSAINAGGTGSKTLSLTVNPATPVVSSTGTAVGQVGVAFTYQITATNFPTGYNATGLPAGLNINTSNGLISGTPTSAATSNITLSATNAGGTGTKTLSLTVNPAAPVVSSTGTAVGQVGVAFSYQITATNSPTSFNAAGLPAGLSINTVSGLISGTPTTAATSNITLSATNVGGTGTKTLSLTINPAIPVVTSASSASGFVGISFSYQMTASNSPTSFNATGIPAGLTVNAVSGLISGTPTTAATSNVTLSALNAGGTGTMTLSLTVNPSPCDLNGDILTNVSDVQLAVNQAIGLASCTTSDINKDTLCNILDVQRVVNAALGGSCLVTP